MSNEQKEWEVKAGYTYLGEERYGGIGVKRARKGPGTRFWATEEEVGYEKYKLIEIKHAPPPQEVPRKRSPGRPRKVRTEDTQIKYPPAMTHVPEE